MKDDPELLAAIRWLETLKQALNPRQEFIAASRRRLVARIWRAKNTPKAKACSDLQTKSSRMERAVKHRSDGKRERNRRKEDHG